MILANSEYCELHKPPVWQSIVTNKFPRALDERTMHNSFLAVNIVVANNYAQWSRLTKPRSGKSVKDFRSWFVL